MVKNNAKPGSSIGVDDQLDHLERQLVGFKAHADRLQQDDVYLQQYLAENRRESRSNQKPTGVYSTGRASSTLPLQPHRRKSVTPETNERNTPAVPINSKRQASPMIGDAAYRSPAMGGAEHDNLSIGAAAHPFADDVRRTSAGQTAVEIPPRQSHIMGGVGNDNSGSPYGVRRHEPRPMTTPNRSGFSPVDWDRGTRPNTAVANDRLRGDDPHERAHYSPEPPFTTAKAENRLPRQRYREMEDDWRQREQALLKKTETNYHNMMEAEKAKLARDYESKLRTELHIHDDEYERKLKLMRDELEYERELKNRDQQRFKTKDEALAEKVEILMKDNTALVRRVEELTLNAEYSEKGSSSIQTELNAAYRDMAELKKALSDLKVKYKESASRLELERNNVARLQLDLDHAHATMEGASSKQRDTEKNLEDVLAKESLTRCENEVLRRDGRELASKLEAITVSQYDLQSEYDKLKRECVKLTSQLTESQDMDRTRKEAEQTASRLLSEARQKESVLREEISCLQRRLSEADVSERALKNMRDEVNRQKREDTMNAQALKTSEGEVKVLTERERKLKLDLQAANNAVMEARRETHQLKKELSKNQSLGNPQAGMGVSSTSPFHHHIVAASTTTLPMQSDPPAGVTCGIQRDSNEVQKYERGSVSPLETTVAQLLNQDTSSQNQRHEKSLDSQLMLLHMEKNEIESQLARYPSATQGRTLRERQQKSHLENRLVDVDCTIHRIRQDLRGRAR